MFNYDDKNVPTEPYPEAVEKLNAKVKENVKVEMKQVTMVTN